MNKASYSTISKPTKYTTVALEENQHLEKHGITGIVETYYIGYTDNKRNKTLDGYYYNKEVKQK